MTCPSGTDLTIGTTSGNVDTVGELGAVRIATKSGKIRVEHATRSTSAPSRARSRSASCAGECHVVFASGKVHIGSAGPGHDRRCLRRRALENGVDGAEVKTVSGKVLLGTSGAGDVSVQHGLGQGRDSGADATCDRRPG